MISKVFMLYIRRGTTPLHHIINQFNIQRFTGKKLIIFDTQSNQSETSHDFKESDNIVYINSQTKLDTELSKNNELLDEYSKTIEEITASINSNIQKKNSLESSIDKLLTKHKIKTTKKKFVSLDNGTINYDSEVNDDAVGDNTQNDFDNCDNTESKKTQLKAITNQLDAEKLKKLDIENNLNEIKAKNIVVIKNKSKLTDIGITINDCKNIAISEYDANVCIFIDDGIYYDPNYMSTMVNRLSKSETGIVGLSKIMVYDRKKNKIIVRKTINPLINIATLSFTKRYGLINDINIGTKITDCVDKKNILVVDNDIMLANYNIVTMKYSNKGTEILSYFKVIS